MSIATFEGIAARNHFAILDSKYAGLDWGVTVMDKAYLKHFFSSPGAENVIHERGVAVTPQLDDGNADSHITRPGPKTFTIKGGIFASAFDDEQTVVFRAWAGAEIVATKTVTLSTDAEVVSFGKHFSHIDDLEITTEPLDGGSGGLVAFDNLKVILDRAVAHEVAHRPVDDFAHLGLDALC